MQSLKCGTCRWMMNMKGVKTSTPCKFSVNCTLFGNKVTANMSK